MNAPDSYLSYFTPGQMSHETLEFILVKRQRLLERLVERVSHSALTDAKHHSLLLGPRGMGKSHMVALTYYRVKALPELQGKIALAWLAEEEWGVASLADLFLIILKALAREYPDSGLAAEIDAFYKLPYDQIENAAAQKLRDFVGNRTLFLLVENLEEIFRGLGKDGQWAFRSFLSERPFVTLLATTPSLFAGIQTQQDAFYGFFTPSYLEELTTEEATELLGKVAARRGDERLTKFLKTSLARDRVRAVHDLAGGHPRIYLLFAHLVTEKNLDELVTPFLKLIDELTPYYQSRMQMLAPQQRKIVEYLCDYRGALSVKDISAACFLSQQTAAAQLGVLEQKQYLRKNIVGRESHYELREPLLRMVIEIKRGRGEPIRIVVDFLRRWYRRNERRQRLNAILKSAELTRLYLEASLDLGRSIHDTPNPSRARKLSTEYQRVLDTDDYDQATEIAAEIIERKGVKCTSVDWTEYSYCLLLSSDFSRALYSLNQSLEIDANNSWAWGLKGIALTQLNRYDEALTCYDKAQIALGSNNYKFLDFRGFTLTEMGDYQEAVSTLNKYIESDSTNESVWLLRAVAMLHIDNWDSFLQSLNHGLSIAASKNSHDNAEEYCKIIFNSNKPEEFQNIGNLTELYAAHNVFSNLGQGILSVVTSLLSHEVSQARAESWLSRWTAAGAAYPDMTVPLRLLAAAVAWKPKHDPRALLALAIEERRILESLLPKDDSD